MLQEMLGWCRKLNCHNLNLLQPNILDDTKLCFLWGQHNKLLSTFLSNSHDSTVHLLQQLNPLHFWERLGYKLVFYRDLSIGILSITLSATYNKLQCLIQNAITVLTLLLDLQGPSQTSNIPQPTPTPCLAFPSRHGKRTEMLGTYCAALCNGKKSTRKCYCFVTSCLAQGECGV